MIHDLVTKFQFRILPHGVLESWSPGVLEAGGG
jgi:hypothetical protein